MHVVVIHRISEPAAFFRIGARPHPNRPIQMRLVHALPSRRWEVCICLWETCSLELLRSYTDDVFGRASANEYYQIDEEEVLGLNLKFHASSFVFNLACWRGP